MVFLLLSYILAMTDSPACRVLNKAKEKEAAAIDDRQGDLKEQMYQTLQVPSGTAQTAHYTHSRLPVHIVWGTLRVAH